MRHDNAVRLFFHALKRDLLFHGTAVLQDELARVLAAWQGHGGCGCGGGDGGDDAAAHAAGGARVESSRAG